MNPRDLLAAAHEILLVDWPSKDVPDALASAGFRVTVQGGPGPEDYFAHEWIHGLPVERRVGRPPERADLVYSYRPINELPGIIGTAKDLQAKTIWTQSGLSAPGVNDPKGCWLPDEELIQIQHLAHSAGLQHVAQPYIADLARQLRLAP
jgi:hypothetical protein